MKYLMQISLLAFLAFSMQSCAQAQDRQDGNAKAAVKTQKNSFPVEKTDKEWKKELTGEEYNILREAGTERAFQNKYVDFKGDGIYCCAACNNPVFDSKTKFHSGTGWPSFYAPISKDNVVEKSDKSMGMTRTEVLCARCGGHLGHIFNDGPKPTGLRYCVNSAALDFQKRSEADMPEQ